MYLLCLAQCPDLHWLRTKQKIRSMRQRLTVQYSIESFSRSSESGLLFSILQWVWCDVWLGEFIQYDSLSTAVEAFAPAANSLAQSAVTSSSSSSELHFFGGGSASKSDLDAVTSTLLGLRALHSMHLMPGVLFGLDFVNVFMIKVPSICSPTRRISWKYGY